MEFADVGSRCADPLCKQHDFLPFACSRCARTFCLQHRSVLAHACENADEGSKTVPECPLCGSMVDAAAAPDVNEAVDRHIASGCAAFVKTSSLNSAHKCSISRCKTKDLIEMKCKHCDKHFCVAHRMPSDHACVPTRAFFSTTATSSSRRHVRVQA